jgi:hypothetical protein
MQGGELLVDLVPEGRVDDARGDGVDVDLVLGQRQRHRLRHVDDARLEAQ